MGRAPQELGTRLTLDEMEDAARAAAAAAASSREGGLRNPGLLGILDEEQADLAGTQSVRLCIRTKGAAVGSFNSDCRAALLDGLAAISGVDVREVVLKRTTALRGGPGFEVEVVVQFGPNKDKAAELEALSRCPGRLLKELAAREEQLALLDPSCTSVEICVPDGVSAPSKPSAAKALGDDSKALAAVGILP